MFQILNGMDFLHSHWIVPNDLKPQNLLLIQIGDQESQLNFEVGGHGGQSNDYARSPCHLLFQKCCGFPYFEKSTAKVIRTNSRH